MLLSLLKSLYFGRKGSFGEGWGMILVLGIALVLIIVITVIVLHVRGIVQGESGVLFS
jgi:hypothetical protein